MSGENLRWTTVRHTPMLGQYIKMWRWKNTHIHNMQPSEWGPSESYEKEANESEKETEESAVWMKVWVLYERTIQKFAQTQTCVKLWKCERKWQTQSTDRSEQIQSTNDRRIYKTHTCMHGKRYIHTYKYISVFNSIGRETFIYMWRSISFRNDKIKYTGVPRSFMAEVAIS